jgi:hypothetical protein
MQPDKPMPPVIAEVRRPHLSANKKAGTLMMSMRMAERPDARKEAV